MILIKKYFFTGLSIMIIWVIMNSVYGCKKFVEAELPIDKTTAKAVFSNTSGASAALSNIYYLFVSNGVVGGLNGPSTMNGLSADEFILYDESNMDLQSLYRNNLTSINGLNNWGVYYDLIFRINSVIEGVRNSSGIPNNAKNELVGQAKFLRGFAYFYLVNLYGGVPIVTSTDYKINMLLPRSTEIAVYDQIIMDLTEALELVSENYLRPDLITITSERVTVNKSVVSAFLARVYLYQGEWQKATDEASKIIGNSKYAILESLNDVFLMNSAEAIWQIEGDVTTGVNSNDGNFFIPIVPTTIPAIFLSNQVLKELSAGDQRRKDWLQSVSIGSDTFYYPFKYKKRNSDNGLDKTTEYNMVLRLSEQYLIRAECRAQLNNLDGAIADLNVIRKRAKVPLYSSLNKVDLLHAIEKERQIELFSEFGHRWFDLKRTGRADEVLAVVKGSDWQTTDKLFPIPVQEFASNPNLRGHQNPGYSEQ